ncbi:MAG: hypothetical protein KAU95_00940, partial [Candidatus Aenigmarchaeota archaeon]|nr:hypothetical protein [Candidatus Aenigmarchaeota archaeon]
MYYVVINTTIYTEGNHTFYATGNDTLGNSHTTNIIVNIDNLPPEVNITSPENLTEVRGNITLNATIEDKAGNGNSSTYFYNDSSWHLLNGLGINWYKIINTTAYSDGNNTICVRANDTVNRTGEDCIILTIDNTPPTVSITSPQNGANVSGTINITTNANDDTTGVGRVEFYLNGTNIGNDTSPDGGGSINYDASGESDGTYNIYAIAYDLLNNSNQSSNISITIDNTPPVINWSKPGENANIKEMEIVEFTIIDNNTNIDKSTINLTDGTTIITGFSHDNCIEIADGFNCSFNWNTSTHPDGIFNLTASGENNAGLSITSKREVTVDNTPPTVSITNPQEGANETGMINITTNATDATTGVGRVEFYLNGTNIENDTSPDGGWSINYDASGESDGTYNIYAIAYDLLNNSNQSSSILITIDNTHPVINWSKPEISANISGTETVEFTIIDIHTNIDKSTINLTDGTATIIIGFSHNNCSVIADGFNCSFNWNTSTHLDGTFNLTASGENNAGLSTTSKREVTVDNTPPSVTINSPGSGTYLNSTLIEINLTVSDAHLDYTNISIHNSTGNLINSTTSSTNGNYAVTLSVPADGIYNITATIYDTVNNTNSAKNTNIIVDTTNPVIYYNNPSTTPEGNHSQNWIFINITANDTNKENVTFEWNGANETFDNSNVNIYWENKTDLGEGTYTIKAYVNDSAGNANQTEMRTITLDTTPPNITNIQVNDTIVKANANLHVNATVVDVQGHLSKIWLKLGGEVICNLTAMGGDVYA